MPQKVNLVFQGGGVKGIAFAGALTALEDLAREAIIIDAVGGVSVGALTAALYAAGYSATELTRVLREKPVAALLRERPPRNRAHAAWRLWRRRGLYSTDAIQNWVDGLLRAKGVLRFRDLTKECRIVAANVTEGTYETYTTQKDANEFVVPAVIKSLSIPLFFTPYADGNYQLFVDGGLLSNNPLWLFSDSPQVTIGLRLVGTPWHGATIASGLFEYLKSLVATMLSAHDLAGRGMPPNVTEIKIDTSFASSADFAIEDVEQQRLFERGKLAVAEFKWNTLPENRSVVFNDPHAGEILEVTANNIEKLFNRSAKNKRRYEKLEIRHHILDEQGWVQMQWHYVLKNGGPDALSMLRYDFGYDTPQAISFKDLGLSVRCGPDPYDAVALPIENTTSGKGFAVAFIPPIAPGDLREVTIEYRSPDFKKLMQRERDLLEIEISHEEGIVEASITVRLPRRLGQLSPTNERGSTPSTAHTKVDNGELIDDIWRFRDLMVPLHLKVDLELR